MTVFTEYLAAVRAYDQEREASQRTRVSTPEKSAEDLAGEAEKLFQQLVQVGVEKVGPAVAVKAVNDRARRMA